MILTPLFRILKSEATKVRPAKARMLRLSSASVIEQNLFGPGVRADPSRLADRLGSLKWLDGHLSDGTCQSGATRILRVKNAYLGRENAYLGRENADLLKNVDNSFVEFLVCFRVILWLIS